MAKRPRNPEEVPMTPSVPLVPPDGLPPQYIDNKPNPDHWRAKVKAVSDLLHAVTVGEKESPKGFNPDQYKNFYAFEAKHAGIDPKHLMDARSDGDKHLDATERLLNAPEELFSVVDAELDILEREFQTAVDGCHARIQGYRAELGNEDVLARERERHEKGKYWLSRVQRVKRLREWIRTTRVPKGLDPVKMVAAVEAAQPLFFMLYVTRSSIAMNLREGRYKDLKIHLIGPPHIKMATDTWVAMNGVDFPTSGPKKGEYVRGARPYEGIILMYPPGHGKTSFVMACEGWMASTDDMMQGAHLHASERKAEEKLAYVKDMFDETTPMGRRRNAIFPGKVKTARHNNASTLNIKSRHDKESPTLQSAGVGSKGLGGNTNKQFWDDVVPASDRDEPTERDRRHGDLMTTWKTRNRGSSGTFIFLSGYPHHYDDALMRIVQDARADKAKFLVSKMAVGGPNTSPKFKSIWPEVYPASFLETQYRTMRSASIWASNFMLDPRAESSQYVKRVRFYDPNTQEHTDFMRSAEFHISVDPTATNRETSDHAGVLYGGLGEVIVKIEKTGEDATQKYEQRFRMLDAARLHLNQLEMADHIAQYVVQRPVYQVHLEVHSSNGSAVRDRLRDEYQLEVQEHSPTSKSKELRLKSCSLILDHSSKEFPSVVEFPGVWDESGNLVCDPRFEWVVKQIINFGVEGQDDIVDAFTQILNHFLRTAQLAAGDAEASRVVRQAIKENGDPRVRAVVRGWFRKDENSDREKEDRQWLNGLSGSQ